MTINKNPLISIITVTFNAASTIEQTILSVINQTYPHIEYIIIDGGSTDGTIDIIKKYSDRISYWVSEPDKGIYDAMNKGINLANGEWINFMNAGDTFYHSNIIEDIFAKKIYEYDIIYGAVNMLSSTYNKIVWPKHNISRSHPMPFNHQSVFVRTSLCKQYPFDISYRYAADYNFFCKIQQDAKYINTNEIIANYSIDGISSTNGISVNKERIKSNPCLYNYYLHLLYYRNFAIKYILTKLGCNKMLSKLKQLQ